MLPLQGKIALVTGASTGIGKAIAAKMAEDGADIIVHYHRSAVEAQDTAAQVKKRGRKAYVVQADLSSQADAEKLYREVKEQAGTVHILVNNVGSAVKRSTFVDADDELWEETFQVNVMSAIRCTRYFYPDMIKAHWGRIITISSMAVRSGGVPTSIHYSAMKAALNTFTLALSKEAGPQGITVNAVSPGLIDTPFQTKNPGNDFAKTAARTPMRRIGRPEDIAPLVSFLASNDASFITGEVYHATGGL